MYPSVGEWMVKGREESTWEGRIDKGWCSISNQQEFFFFSFFGSTPGAAAIEEEKYSEQS